MKSVAEGGEGEAKMASIGDEPLSPAARLFHAPSLNCYVIAIMGCKTSINPQVIKEGLCQTLLKHPRFTCKLVKKGRKTRWTLTTVNIDNHVIVPEIDSKIDFPDRFVEDYISHFTKTPLDLSKPLWELHLLNIKTSDAEAVGILRIHHSMGDGASLMSLLLATTRKISDPDALPTVPTKKGDGLDYNSRSFWWLFSAIWWGLVLIWHTMVDLLLFVLSIFIIKDTQTPLKGAPGVELNTKRFVHRTVSIDDIKLVKNEMKTDLADMMAKKSKAKWGNGLGYIILPFSIALQEDPLEYVRQAKATIDRKKHSLEAICTHVCAKLVINLFGVKFAAAITGRVLFNTTVSFSNVLGPEEEIGFYGHPVAYIAPSVYGHPQALTIHYQSYANKMTISVSVDPSVIPDPYILCDDLEESLILIVDAVQKKLVVDVVV